MKENLMLGVLVLYKNQHCKVVILSTNGAVGVLDKKDATTVVQEQELELIPLTKEILEKNGFKIDMYSTLQLCDGKWLEYYHHESRLRMWWKGVDEWENHSIETSLIFQCHVWNVHELQHALRMCGIKKEIKL